MSTQSGSNFTAIAAMMLVVGMGIPVTAALNAVVGTHLQSSVAASTILFGLGFLLTAAVLAVVGPPPLSAFSSVPIWAYAAVLGVFFYVLSVTWSAPRIGVGNAIFFVLLGQLIAAATIDHFGLFGALKTELTARRARLACSSWPSASTSPRSRDETVMLNLFQHPFWGRAARVRKWTLNQVQGDG